MKIIASAEKIKILAKYKSLNFDVIDADAWGSPFYQIEKIFSQNYKGIVHCTFIQTMHGDLSKEMLLRLGYTEKMLSKVKSIFNKNGIEKFKNVNFKFLRICIF